MNNQEIKCPHCGGIINPASIMGKLSAEKRKLSSEEASRMARIRWGKKK